MKKIITLLITLAVFWSGCNDGSDNDPGTPGAEEKILYVDANASGAAIADGTKLYPMSELSSDTIKYARDRGCSKIYVAAGEYETSGDGIEMIEGISLYGGYDPDNDWSRFDVKTETARHDNPTIITNIDNTSTLCKTISMGDEIMDSTILEGFIINGGGGTYSYGISNRSSYSVIFNNTIDGGTGSDSSCGIYNRSSSSVIFNNTINGGSGKSSYGINNSSSSPEIFNNTINGGGGDVSYGISNHSSCFPIISNNTIFSRSGINYKSLGIYNYNESDPKIYNNIIVVSNGQNFLVGICNLESSSPTVKNNCISVQGTDEGTDYADLDNNLVGTNPGIDFTTDTDGDGVANWHGGYTLNETA